MGKEELKQELLKTLSDAVVEYDEDKVKEASQKVLDEELNAIACPRPVALSEA